MIYSSLGREVPTYENFDAEIFVRIYALLQECQGLFLTDAQREDYWAPLVEEVRKMHPIPVTPDNGAADVHDTDVEMREDAEDSDWELGSGVDSQESGGEAGGEQGEGETNGVQGET